MTLDSSSAYPRTSIDPLLQLSERENHLETNVKLRPSSLVDLLLKRSEGHRFQANTSSCVWSPASKVPNGGRWNDNCPSASRNFVNGSRKFTRNFFERSSPISLELNRKSSNGVWTFRMPFKFVKNFFSRWSATRPDQYVFHGEYGWKNGRNVMFFDTAMHWAILEEMTESNFLSIWYFSRKKRLQWAMRTNRMTLDTSSSLSINAIDMMDLNFSVSNHPLVNQASHCHPAVFDCCFVSKWWWRWFSVSSTKQIFRSPLMNWSSVFEQSSGKLSAFRWWNFSVKGLNSTTTVGWSFANITVNLDDESARVSSGKAWRLNWSISRWPLTNLSTWQTRSSFVIFHSFRKQCSNIPCWRSESSSITDDWFPSISDQWNAPIQGRRSDLHFLGRTSMYRTGFIQWRKAEISTRTHWQKHDHSSAQCRLFWSNWANEIFSAMLNSS